MRIDFEDKGNGSGDGAGTEFRQTEGSKEQKYDKKEVGRILGVGIRAKWKSKKISYKSLYINSTDCHQFFTNPSFFHVRMNLMLVKKSPEI